jgi:hypothetical protein
MSSHSAARCCRVICCWESTASSTHENENPAANNFAQGVDMPRQTAKPAAACSPIQFYSVYRLSSGWPSARHTCLAPATPTAYRAVLPFSRTAWCNTCAPGRSQPCYSSQSPFVGKSVGGPRHAFLESIFIDLLTLNGTRPNSPLGVKPARPLVARGTRPRRESDPSPTRSGTRVAVFPSVRGGARP